MAAPLPSSVLDLPILPPPPGQIPNFVDPESCAYEIYIAAGICFPLIALFAVLRVYAKVTAVKRRALWSELIFFLGLGAGVTYMALTVAAVHVGTFGLHGWDTRVGSLTQGQLLILILILSIYGPCIWLIKLSLFVLYLEIFGPLRWFRYATFGGIIVTGLFYFATLIVYVVDCRPLDGQNQLSYLEAVGSPQCRALNTSLATVVRAANVVSDLYLLVLPLPAVWALNLDIKRRLGVSAMFLTGSIACVASIIGLAREQVVKQNQDYTWTIVPLLVTVHVEMTAGIMVCCMPAIAAIYRQVGSRTQTQRSQRLLSGYGSKSYTGIGTSQSGQHAYQHRNYQGSNDVHADGYKAWSRSELPDPIYFQDLSIRKTTEIEVEKMPPSSYSP